MTIIIIDIKTNPFQNHYIKQSMNGKIMQSNNVLPFYISTTGKKVFQTGRVIVTMIGITSYFLLTIASDYCYKLSLDSSRFLQSSSSKERLIQHGMVFAIIDFLTRKVSMCFFSWVHLFCYKCKFQFSLQRLL